MLDVIRPYKEGDIEKLDIRDMDLFTAGKDYVESIKRNISQSQQTLTVEVKGEILMIIGLAILAPGSAETWSITGKPVEKYKKTFAQVSSFLAYYWMELYGLHRLQLTVYEKHEKSIRWLEWLGFEREGLLRQFGASRLNFYIYARLKWQAH